MLQQDEQHLGHSSTSWTVHPPWSRSPGLPVDPSPNAAPSNVTSSTLHTPAPAPAAPPCSGQQQQQQQHIAAWHQPARHAGCRRTSSSQPSDFKPESVSGCRSSQLPALDSSLSLQAGTISITVSSPHLQLYGTPPEGTQACQLQQRAQQQRQQLQRQCAVAPGPQVRVPGGRADSQRVPAQHPAALQNTAPAAAGRRRLAEEEAEEAHPLECLAVRSQACLGCTRAPAPTCSKL